MYYIPPTAKKPALHTKFVQMVQWFYWTGKNLADRHKKITLLVESLLIARKNQLKNCKTNCLWKTNYTHKYTPTHTNKHTHNHTHKDRLIINKVQYRHRKKTWHRYYASKNIIYNKYDKIHWLNGWIFSHLSLTGAEKI